MKKTQMHLALAAAMMLAPQASLTLTPTNKPEKSWYSLKAQNGNAELMIYDEIGGWGISARQFASDLQALGKIGTLTARIHSPGGDVFECMAIYNMIKGHPAHKVCHIDGLAASMASVPSAMLNVARIAPPREALTSIRTDTNEDRSSGV